MYPYQVVYTGRYLTLVDHSYGAVKKKARSKLGLTLYTIL